MKSKSPEAGFCLAFLRKSKLVKVARTERRKRSKGVATLQVREGLDHVGICKLRIFTFIVRMVNHFRILSRGMS